MREVNIELIRDAVRNLSIEANYFLGQILKRHYRNLRKMKLGN